TEIGQGTRTIFVQIAASELGVPIDLIEMEEPDTSKVPDSGPTVASRTCMIIGGVIQQVACTIKEQLKSFVAERFDSSNLEVRDGWFGEGKDPHLIFFQDAAREYVEVKGPLEVHRRYSSPPGIKWDDDEYRGDAYPVFSWAADVIE